MVTGDISDDAMGARDAHDDEENAECSPFAKRKPTRKVNLEQLHLERKQLQDDHSASNDDVICLQTIATVNIRSCAAVTARYSLVAYYGGKFTRQARHKLSWSAVQFIPTSHQKSLPWRGVKVYPRVLESRGSASEKVLMVAAGYSLDLRKASVLADSVLMRDLTDSGVVEFYVSLRLQQLSPPGFISIVSIQGSSTKKEPYLAKLNESVLLGTETLRNLSKYAEQEL
ncbi:hypothetical protein HPB51_006753 [Rhipicephalus microplus]|uniref:Uncharacterized protein n=1 Tax=Rhipicephalus microplus TaxID=6941 RepID=A0A9J6E823_RHIMP|nr:hypothetical protein HPB51_006753 [Rhipicephalus microplus]